MFLFLLSLFIFQVKPQVDCFNNCTNGNGICDVATQTCNCTGGYTGVLCQFAPGQDQCNSPAECGNNACDGWSCVGTPRMCVKSSPVVCPTGDNCLFYDVCDPTTGTCPILENRTITCDDGNGCTDDYCNPTDGSCYYLNRSCSFLDSTCDIGYCNPSSPKDSQCFAALRVCPNPNSCNSSFCVQNASFCGCLYSGCPAGSTEAPTPPPTPCLTASPTPAPTAQPTQPQTGPIAPTIPTAETPTDPPGDGGGLSTGALIGIIVGASVGGLCLVIVIGLIVYKVMFAGSGSEERV